MKRIFGLLTIIISTIALGFSFRTGLAASILCVFGLLLGTKMLETNVGTTSSQSRFALASERFVDFFEDKNFWYLLIVLTVFSIVFGPWVYEKLTEKPITEKPIIYDNVDPEQHLNRHDF